MGLDKFIMTLNEIKDNDFNFPENISKMDLTFQMLEISAEDNVIYRNSLVYEILFYSITVKNIYSTPELNKILFIVLDDSYLFYRINFSRDSSVYKRNFSILIIGLILNRHRFYPLFNKDTFMLIKEKLVKYYIEEKDLRSYFNEYGWFHGMTHGPDARDEIIQCNECNSSICKELLEAIKVNLYNERAISTYEEDEYLTVIIHRMIEKNYISPINILKWFIDLSDINMKMSRQHYIDYINVRNLIRSFYFRLLHKGLYLSIVPEILALEKYMNRFLD